MVRFRNKVKTMKTVWLWVWLMCCAGLAQAQTAEVWEKIKARYPDEGAVFLDRSEVLTLYVEGDSLRGYTDVNEELIHLKDQLDSYSSRKVYGSYFHQVANLKAKTLVWDKNRYREVEVNGFTKTNARGDGVFYDDSYYYAFNFPSLAMRNRTQLQYRELMKDVRFVSGFLFSSYAPQVRVSYTIQAPKEVELYYKVENDDQQQIHFKKTEKGKMVIYEWSADYLPTVRAEEGSPSIRYYEPHLVCYVKSFVGKSGRHQVLNDLNALHQWYRTFLAGVSREPSPELQAIVADLKKKSPDEITFVRHVFQWVQDNIRYIAFEQGMRGFIPHAGSYTCEKRYGDCKDMANIIVFMLEVGGVKTYHTWIGSRDIPYRYTEYPTPIVDNHMIATYISPAGQYYFLDATDSRALFGFPSGMIQGKEALISLSADKFEIREVPPVPREKNLHIDSTYITIDHNVIKGKGRSSFYGMMKSESADNLDRIEEKDVRDYLSSFLQKGNNKFLLDTYQVHGLKNREVPTRIDYTFHISDYCQLLGDELYINLNLSKDNYNRFINEETRKTPHEFSFKYEKRETIVMTIPDGFEVEYLPENASFQGKLSGYQVQYRREGNKLYCYKTYYIDYLLMMPSDFKVWNKEVGMSSEVFKETIILKKK